MKVKVLKALPISSGEIFQARQFRSADYDEIVNPLLMVDDYVMTKPTFGAHAHGGLSAISLIFEDTKGYVVNRDTLGNHLRLNPGDLYWLNAGSGAMHDEYPGEGAEIRGLQIFVKLDISVEHGQPSSKLLRAKDVPIHTASGVELRVLIGNYLSTQGMQGLSNPMDLIEGKLQAGASFRYQLKAGYSAWIYCRTGELSLSWGGDDYQITAGEALGLSSASSLELGLYAKQESHIVLLSALSVDHAYERMGPYAFSDRESALALKAKFEAGELGSLDYEAVAI